MLAVPPDQTLYLKGLIQLVRETIVFISTSATLIALPIPIEHKQICTNQNYTLQERPQQLSLVYGPIANGTIVIQGLTSIWK